MNATVQKKVVYMKEAPKFEGACSSCNLREICLPGGLCVEDRCCQRLVPFGRCRPSRTRSLRWHLELRLPPERLGRGHANSGVQGATACGMREAPPGKAAPCS